MFYDDRVAEVKRKPFVIIGELPGRAIRQIFDVFIVFKDGKDMIVDLGYLKGREHSEDLEGIRNSARKKVTEKIPRSKKV